MEIPSVISKEPFQASSYPPVPFCEKVFSSPFTVMTTDNSQYSLNCVSDAHSSETVAML